MIDLTKTFEETMRELPDGRVLLLYEQLFNWKLTISTRESWEFGFYDDSW